MPELSLRAQPWTNEDRQRLAASIGLASNNVLKQFVQEIQTTNLIADAFAESFRQMRETIILSFVGPLRRMNEQLRPIIAEATVVQLKMIKFTSLSHPVYPFNNTVDGEFGETKEVDVPNSDMRETALIPRPAVTTTSIETFRAKNSYVAVFEDFNMAETIEGRFYYENILLEHISANSKHGQFLKLLLEAKENYIADVFALSQLNPSDLEKGLGYIKDDLAKYLAKDGLDIKLYRARKKGYKLLRISRPSN